MNPSIIKRKLANGDPTLAAKVNFGSPQIVEMVGMMGFDCLWLGNEHLWADESRIDHMILAARASGMDTMIRRVMSGYDDLLQPLEMGVHGFMIPRVRSVRYIEEVVSYVKFPPEGRRGLDGVNADADFGLLPLPDYLERANRESFIVAQIEDAESLSIVDEVAAVPGVDVLFIGHGDLSLSLGIPGKVRDPQILGAVDAVANACAKHGKQAGIPTRDPQDAEALMDKGFRFFTCPGDYSFVRRGFEETRDAFSKVGFTFRSR